MQGSFEVEFDGLAQPAVQFRQHGGGQIAVLATRGQALYSYEIKEHLNIAQNGAWHHSRRPVLSQRLLTPRGEFFRLRRLFHPGIDQHIACPEDNTAERSW